MPTNTYVNSQGTNGRRIRIYLNGVCIEMADDVLQPSMSPEIVLNEYHTEETILTLAKDRVYVRTKPLNRKLDYLNAALTAGILLVSIIGIILVFRN